EREKYVRAPLVPGARQRFFELMKAAQRHIGQKLVAIAEMPVRRGGTDTRPSRRLRKGEAGRPLLRDQFKRGAQQCFLEIAVVVAARAFLLVLGPAHVNSIYMRPDLASMLTVDADKGIRIKPGGPAASPAEDRQ